MVPIMFHDRTFFRLALIGTLVASLGLAACGRKGPLDPPPGASLANEPQAEAPATPGSLTMPIGGDGQSRNNSLAVDNNGRLLAPPGVKKRIPLDVLLN
jgi:predicted small lipoprotein YifL